MKDKLKEIAAMTKSALSSAAIMVGDLNGDGKVDEEDLRIAGQWTKGAVTSVGKEVQRLGTHALHSEMVKDAAAGAVAGVTIGAPLPLIGPVTGASIGAGIGVYKNLSRKGMQSSQQFADSKAPIDFHDELLKLDDLRQKGLLSDEEFKAEKKRLLRERS